MVLMAQAAASAMMVNVSLLLFGPRPPKKRKTDHWSQPRSKRVKLNHARALFCIREDYLGFPHLPTVVPNKLKEFKLHFRLSRDRFECLMADVVQLGYPFYMKTTRKGASLEARLLLPLKTLAYGVPPHAFCDYFQMSKSFARDACTEFDKVIKELYAKEYLRLPDEEDLKNIVKLHKAVHKVDGMFGSLDCTHTVWKQCPKAWNPQFKGKEKKATIVKEACCDYQMWFWHVSYGYAGTLNDLTILDASPLLESFISGAFEGKEDRAGVVPYMIGTQVFNKLFILVDGIYPKYSRFAKGLSQPIHKEQKNYTKWQEAARKDIERAFGVLKQTWQFMERPIRMEYIGQVTVRVGTCVILHNILVQDRVMGPPNLGGPKIRYNPAARIRREVEEVRQPNNLSEVLRQHKINRSAAPLGNPSIAHKFKRAIRWRELEDKNEHIRLYEALVKQFGSGEAAFS